MTPPLLDYQAATIFNAQSSPSKPSIALYHSAVNYRSLLVAWRELVASKHLFQGLVAVVGLEEGGELVLAEEHTLVVPEPAFLPLAYPVVHSCVEEVEDSLLDSYLLVVVDKWAGV